MTATEKSSSTDDSFLQRLVKVAISIVVLVPVTVFIGYGGWMVLTITATLGLYNPDAGDGEPLRERLFEWPERNREVMRTNGNADLPLKP